MGMGDLSYAQKMRDIIFELVRSEVGRLRPKPANAIVDSVDQKNNKCMIKFAGETDAVPVKLYTLRPTAAGDIVRVEGDAGNRYVAEVISGKPGLHMVATDGSRYLVTVGTTGAFTSTAIV